MLLFAFSAPAFAQSNAQIEKELLAGIKEIQKYGTYGGAYDEEKLSDAQDAFQKKLLKYTKIAATLKYKFAALDDEMKITTSDDGKLRIYSWDLEDGGTMHDYANVYQYLAADGKVYSKTNESTDEGDYGAFVTDIFSLATTKGNVYIVCSTFIGSNQDHGQSANLYKIAGDKLDNNVKLIKTKSGLTSSLSFGYNAFSADEREGKLISFNKKTKTLKIPVVVENEEYPNGEVTDKFISYRFNGKYFVKI
jgi:hypothetical protein